jgi:hypothetical protein
MKLIFTRSLLLLTFTFFSLNLYSQVVTRTQIIHNAADPGVALIDLYLDDVLIEDDFAFREATAFFNPDFSIEKFCQMKIQFLSIK